MESQSPKLSLDLSPPWLVGEQKKEPDKPSELLDYIAQLEHELRKIESFKRELPLSVVLLTDAIGRLKEEVGRNGKELARVVCDLDESPRAGSENTDAGDGDKKNWMRSAQLWSSDHTSFLQLNSKRAREKAEDGQACRYTEKGGALSSFNVGSEPAKEDVDTNKPVLDGLGLCLQVISEPAAGMKRGGEVRDGGGDRNTSAPVLIDQMKLRYQSSPPAVSSALQGQKKQRRCWSPELHRRFIDALEKLGGSQVATPKQIRELMQVNGLTNDEVKSHLQKYRLHIRKLPNPTTSLAKDKLFASKSGSPQGPLNLAVRSAQCNSAASRCGSMEEDGEEKSDSHSWEDH